jgi:hypothetical protein
MRQKNSISIRLALLLFLLIENSAYAQSWMKAYYLPGGMVGYGVVEDTGDGFTIVGSRALLNQNKIRMIQVDYNGDTIKMKDHCGFEGSAITKDYFGGYYVTGIASSCIPNVQYDIEVLHVDSNLNELWKIAYGNTGIDKGKRIINDYDSGFVMACYNTSYPDLIHIDKHGSQIWSMNYGLSGLTSIKRNLEGGYFICGNAGGGFVDPLYVAKIDSIGNVIWYKTFYNPNGEIFTDIEPMADSGVVAVTDYNGLYKLSSTGDSLWMKAINVPAQRLITSNDGNILIAGGGMSLTKVDTAGNILWSYLYWIYPAVVGVLGYDGWDVIETSDGGFLLVGEIDSLGTKNLYVVKTDSIGQVTTGLNNYEPNFSAFCYPQPFREQTTITLSNEQSIGAPNKWILSVYNIQGILLREEPVSGFPYIFKRNNLTSGIYLYTITQAGKIPITGKMVVE